MRKKVGIPRGMLYYEFYPMWENFFCELNYEVVSSPKTNKDILDSGILNCVDEACLPIKIFHGHVNYLKDKVDYIFIPKMISLYPREYCCPKILGLPDMIKHSIKDLPIIIDTQIIANKKGSFEKSYIEIGKFLGKSHRESLRAFKRSIKTKNEYKVWLMSQYLNANINIDKGLRDNIKLLLLGHSYNVFDEIFNMGILDKLSNKNINVIVAEEVCEKDIRYYSDLIPKRIFWTHGRKIIGAAFTLIDKGIIDGIIHLNSFGCGLDSVLSYVVLRKAIENNIPMMELTLDEQTGEAGFNTRLEAFLDMMEWRGKNEDNIPSLR